MSRDLYQVLGVPRDANDDQIKRAYRKLAHDFHPDKNSGADAEEFFKEATAAYEVLSDAQRRRQYDRTGAYGAGTVDPAAAVVDVFSDLFGDMFRSGAPRKKPNRGADHTFSVRVTFDEAMRGTSRPVSYARYETCTQCHGDGSPADAPPSLCRACGGHGKVGVQQGIFQLSKKCTFCSGSGRVVSVSCDFCAGTGRRLQERQREVQIPEGVEDGEVIRLAGEGDAMADGPSGDLLVTVQVESHAVLERRGRDLRCLVPLPCSIAMLGGTIKVPTWTGSASVKVPKGTQHGDLLRLKGKGVPGARGKPAGDQIVQLSLEVPKSLSLEEEGALAAYRDLEMGKRYPRTQAWYAQFEDPS